MAERKKIIALDCDDVLIDLNEGLHPFHNKHFGTNVTPEDLNTYNLWEIWHCAQEDVVERVFRFYDSDEFMDLVPVAGAVEGVAELKEKYGLIIVSTRPPFLLERTRRSVEKHFPDCFDEICLTDFTARKLKKSQVCLELGADTLVDDNFGNVKDSVEHGIRSILFRRRWNISYSDSQLKNLGIIPAKNWEEVVNLLKY